jgi:hypothetical protein
MLPGGSAGKTGDSRKGWDLFFSAVRRGTFVASKIKQSFKLRQERNMPPRLPRRNTMKAGRGWLAAP